VSGGGSDDYGRAALGAVIGQCVGVALALAVAWLVDLAKGGDTCGLNPPCDEPSVAPVLVFMAGAVVALVVGGAAGCYLALRAWGDPARVLTSCLVAVLTVVAVLIPAVVVLIGPPARLWLLYLGPAVVVAVPLAARYLATRYLATPGGRGAGAPPERGDPSEAPVRRAW